MKKNLKFEKNYANTEYADRHNGNSNMSAPKQEALEWHKWPELIAFFREYFKYFGDDTSALDDETFGRMVKTIWRFSNVAAFRDGMKFHQENTPSFYEQFKEWTIEIARSTDEAGFNWADIIPDEAKAALANNYRPLGIR